MGDEWKSYLDTCLVNTPGSFWALALGYANEDDLGTLFSATSTGEDHWTPFYAEPHTVEIDGKQEQMNETAHLAKILKGLEKGGDFPRFLYLGTQKYQVTRTDSETVGDNTFATIMFAGPGKGGAIVRGPTYFVVGLYDEKKEQNKSSCCTDVFKVCEQVNAS